MKLQDLSVGQDIINMMQGSVASLFRPDITIEASVYLNISMNDLMVTICNIVGADYDDVMHLPTPVGTTRRVSAARHLFTLLAGYLLGKNPKEIAHFLTINLSTVYSQKKNGTAYLEVKDELIYNNYNRILNHYFNNDEA